MYIGMCYLQEMTIFSFFLYAKENNLLSSNNDAVSIL